MAAGATKQAAGDGRGAVGRAPRGSTRVPRRPNKPMVATATSSLAEHSRELGRRHIGQPFGRYEQA